MKKYTLNDASNTDYAGDYYRVSEVDPKLALLNDMARCLNNLLWSADSTWYERNEGHDWKDEVDSARKILSRYKEI